jgi:hypothetical protein
MQTHTESITSNTHTYAIQMKGTLDGVNTRDPVGYSPYRQNFEPNMSVRLENVGETEVVNPWVVVNGKRDWRSLDHVLGEILSDDMTDSEKARAIWEFARTHRYHFTCADDEVKDTVKMLNVYGYTLCWDEAYTVSNLWQAAGLKIRRGYPHGHCTTEVYYDGAFHLLDSDEHLLYLLRDNRTVAAEEDLANDRDLVKRGHAYGVLQGEDPEGAEGAAALFFFTGPRAGGRPLVGDHQMDMTLRPGEALIWEWEDRGKFHGYWERPKRLSNGRMTYEPDLSTLGRWADCSDGWAFDKRGLHPGKPGEAARLELTIRSPYVVVGGKVDLALVRGAGDSIKLDLSRDGKNWHPVIVPDEIGEVKMTLNLDSIFAPDRPATYAYTLRLEARSNDAPTALLMTRMAVETDLQMAPLSLPALEVGENHIEYTAESGGQVRITHAWDEKDAEPAPDPPEEPDYPQEARTVPGTRFTFTWPAVKSAVDYHFQLSDRADMIYLLSPVFEKLSSRTPADGAPRWEIPYEGLLNPGQTYYWRVRARNGGGLWGAWSSTWSFVPEAPGVPLQVEVVADDDRRTLMLNWQANPEGNTPAHYEVYGSDERGFSAGLVPYCVMTTNDKKETFPANLMGTTEETTLQVAGPSVDPGGFAFYRVVAVDEAGVRSGPSDLAVAPRPMIVSMPGATATVGEVYTYQIRTTSAIGELRAERVGSQNYVRAIRGADELRFLLDEGPHWTEIDEQTGVFTARPGPEHRGFHTITVRVQNGQGGMDMQGFDLEVID